jgi:hypothetical protein
MIHAGVANVIIAPVIIQMTPRGEARAVAREGHGLAELVFHSDAPDVAPDLLPRGGGGVPVVDANQPDIGDAAILVRPRHAHGHARAILGERQTLTGVVKHPFTLDVLT